MKILTATEARRRFGALLNAVQKEPVLVRRKNGNRVVLISAERYKQMTGIAGVEAEPLSLARKMTSSRKSR